MSLLLIKSTIFMPIKKAAAKSIRKDAKRQLRNLRVKILIKNLSLRFRKAIQAKDKNTAQALLKELQKVLDKAAQKKIITKNKAARKKSRLAKKLRTLL